MLEQQGFQPLHEDTQSVSGLIREPVGEVRELAISNVAFTKLPKSSSELAAFFGVTKEAVQDWFKLVSQAYCWVLPTELKFGVGKNTRYTPFCIEQMFCLKASKEAGQTASEWIASVHAENAEAIAAWKASQLPKEQPLQSEVTVETPSVTPVALFKPEVLALYNQSQQRQTSLPAKGETKLYFTPTDYSNRYTSTELMVANQAGKEVNFANELLARFAEMAADNKAWNQAENQKEDVQQRDAAVRGMQRALNEFLNENTAYRGLKHQLETGQITPEQVLAMLMQFQGKGQSPDGSSVAS